jgi:hypothetical protein
MIDLNHFIGASGREGKKLSYIVDGTPMPDSFGKFASVTPTFALLHGGAFKLGQTYLLQGSLTLALDPNSDQGVISVAFDIGDENDASVHKPSHDQATITYKVTAGGEVLQLAGKYTTMGPFDGFVRQIDGGQNTEISAAFQYFFDGKAITAQLVPKT